MTLAPSLLVAFAACTGDPTTRPTRSHPNLHTGTPDDSGIAPVVGPGARLHPDFGTLVIVTWQQDQAGSAYVEFTGADGALHRSPARDLEAGEHDEILIGATYESTVSWRVVLDEETLAEGEIETADWPYTLPSAVVTVADPGLQDPAMPYVLLSMTELDGGMGDPWWVIIADREGRPVWAWRTPDTKITMHARIGNDGRSLLLDENAYWGTFGSGGASSSIRRMLLDGTVLETWDAPGLHHPFVELPDGTIAYGSMSFPYLNEWLIEIAPDRSTRTVFDCEQWLFALGVDDECGSNTLTYRESTDSYLFSFYSFDSILDIPRSGGAPTRTFGEIPGSYAFDPSYAGMWWQHGGYWTEQGTLVTSTYRYEGGPFDHPENEETIVREWAVDDADRTLRLVWDFGVGHQVYGAQMGEAHLLPSGNVLHNLGTSARLREGLRDGTVVWDVSWDPEQDMGRSVPISDLYDFLPERR